MNDPEKEMPVADVDIGKRRNVVRTLLGKYLHIVFLQNIRSRVRVVNHNIYKNFFNIWALPCRRRFLWRIIDGANFTFLKQKFGEIYIRKLTFSYFPIEVLKTFSELYLDLQ